MEEHLLGVVMLFNKKTKMLSWVSIFVITYTVFILSQAFLANMFLAIPRPELFKFGSILIAPSLISGPLLYWSRRNSPKINVWLFITAIELHFVCFFLGLTYAGTKLKYISEDTARNVWPFIILTSIITAGMLWGLCNRKIMLLARR